MKFPKLFFILSFVLLSYLVSSQSRAQNQSRSNLNDTANHPYWIEMMQDQNANFFDVQRAAEIYFANRYKGKGSGWKQYKRWEYFMETRVSANGNRYAPDHVWNEYNTQSQTEGPSSSMSGTWTELGPISMPNNGTGQPNGLGRVNCVAFHPTNSNIIWVGAPSGGLWKTTNGGTTWSSNTDNLPTLGVSSILIDSINPNIMYIGTGDRDGGDAPGMGVMKSTNGGVTWTLSNTGMGNKVVGMMLMNPSNSSIILAATSGGVYRTTNAGAMWTKTSNTTNYKDIKYKPGDPSIVYATSSGDFYRSTNGGVNWTQIYSGIPGTGRLVIGVSPANPAYVYALVGSSTGLTGLYRSTNNGQSFSTISVSPNILGYSATGNDTRSQAWYDLAIAVDPTNANIIYAGGINIWKSTNGGTNWSLNAHWVGSGGVPAVHADIHSLDFSPLNGRLYCGNDGGVHYTTNGGTSWPEISSGLAIAQVYKIGQSAQAANHVINGYQDNGTAIYSSTGWSTEIGGDGMECIIDPSNSNYIYGALYYGDIRRSTNAGIYFSTIADDGVNGINESGAWVTPYTLHSTNPNTMFIGYNNLWRSTNVKASSSSSVSWTKISSYSTTTDVRVVEHSPANVNLLYFTRSNRLYRSDNVNSASPNWGYYDYPYLPNNATIIDLEAHPTNQNIVYMSQSNNIYKSSTKGTSWTDISANLPNVSINCIVYDTSSNEGLYVGTDLGVFYKDASMSQWIPFSTGLPVSGEITELEIYYNPNPSNSRITAATYGRGLWQSDLYTSGSTNIINFTANSTNLLVGDSINFTDQSSPTPTSWQWTFNGGTPSTSNLQNPIGIKYNTAGAYDVKLVATTANGTDSLIKTGYIMVYTTNPYCAASGITCDEYIGNVILGSINDTTTCGNYVDYTATQSTGMTIGNSYSLTVINPQPYSGDQCGVWVDWNQDNDFYDANETLNVIGGPGTFTSTIIPPSSAVLGATRMRIRVQYTGTVSPCGTTTYGEVEDYTIVVQAAAANLLVSPSNHNVTDQSGSVQFFVGSNVSWSATDNASWLSLTPSSGTGNATTVATYSANTSANPRTATITFTASGVSNQVVTVVQAGVTPFLTVTPSNQNVGAATGGANYTITSNVSWSASDNASWLTLSPSSGTGNGTLTASFTANTSANPRTATITFTGTGVSNQIVTVTQAGAAAFLTVTPSNQNVGDASGYTAFTVNSNISWSASDNASWLSLSPSSGNGNGMLTATFTANTSVNQRTATITFTGSGVSNQIVTVTQDGIYTYLNIYPPSQNVSEAAGSMSFGISSTNVTWSATDNASWLSLNPTSGSSSGLLIATYTANTNANPRTATITVSGAGVSNQIATLTQAGAALFLSVSPSNQNVGAASGSTNFTVTSNISWSATDNATWLSLSPSSGTGNGSLVATFATNTSANPRTATITITGGGVANQIVTLTQAGTAPYLMVSPSNQNVSDTAGTWPFIVSSNISWSATDNASWVTLNPTSGTGNGLITASYTSNTSVNPRTATITVTGSGAANQVVTLTQAGVAAFLTVTPSNQNVSDVAGSTNFTIASNVTWSATDNASWLSLNPTNGTGNVMVTATFTANASANPRTATITFTGSGVSNQVVTITQAGTALFLTVSPTSQNVGAAAGSTNFTITSNVSWSASDNASWLTLNPTTGNGNGTLSATYTANATSTPRAAIITVSGNGVNNQTVTLIQMGGSSSSLIVTPSNQNVSDAAGSTNFTITSNVNWAATDSVSWLSLSPASGTGNGTLTATFTANTNANPRTATITVTGSGVSNQTVTVTQAGIAPSLAVNPSSQSVTSAAGNTSFNIVSNITWSATSNASWLSLSPSGGNGNGNILAIYTANTSANSRTATITVSGSGVPSQTATVVQAGSSIYLTITPSNQNVTSAAGSVSYTINSNVSWTLTDDQSWLTVTPDSGNGNATITASYTFYSNSAPRIATISVVGVGISAIQQATLTQASSGPYMIINPMVYDVGAPFGLVRFYLTSNANWNAISSANWLTINPTSGYGDDTITATFAVNQNYDSRTAYITVNAQNVGTYLLTVNQEGFGVGVAEQSLENLIKIYPNPVKELLYVYCSENYSYQLKLYNVLGEVLYIKEFKSIENIDVSKLAKGIYFLEVIKTSGDFDRVVRKIIVE